MKRFIEGEDRTQVSLLPPCLEDYVEAENPVRVVEVFVDGLDLDELGFEAVDPAATGRPAYHPAVLLKLYMYGYLNRIQSSRRLEREAQRNVELMWLTGRLMPDFKTIANFRKDNGRAIRQVCRQFIVLCRQLNLFTEAIVAIDGSKFKAVNNRDKNFTPAKMQRRMAQIEESIARYLAAMDTADRAEPEAGELKKGHLRDKIAALKEQMQQLRMREAQMLASPDQQSVEMTRVHAGVSTPYAQLLLSAMFSRITSLQSEMVKSPGPFLQLRDRCRRSCGYWPNIWSGSHKVAIGKVRACSLVTAQQAVTAFR